MNQLSEMDLGATVLSIALAAGFVAFGLLLFRLLVNGVKTILRKLKYNDSNDTNTATPNEKGFKEIKD